MKMCPLFPFHYIILYVCLLGPLWLLSSHVSAKGPVGVSPLLKNQPWNIAYDPSEVEGLEEDQERNVSTYLTLDLEWWDKTRPLLVKVETDDIGIAEVSGQTEFPLNTTQESFNFTFFLKGKAIRQSFFHLNKTKSQ